MSEIQRRWKVGAYNYEGRRRRRTVWHVLVRGKRELARWHSGPAIRAHTTHGAHEETTIHIRMRKKQPSTIVAKDDNQKEN